MPTNLTLNFLAYFAASLAAWALTLRIYAWITPYPEFRLVREGNEAAAWSLGGTAIGLAIPMASLVVHAVSFADLLVWAFIAMAAQLALWLTLRGLVFRDLSAAVGQGRTSVGMLLGALAIGLGLINAACVSY